MNSVLIIISLVAYLMVLVGVTKLFNERELKTKYKNFIKKQDRVQNKEIAVDDKWVTIRTNVYKRDGYRCRLLSKLSVDELNIVRPQLVGQNTTLDAAHFIPRSKNEQAKYDVTNVITLIRMFHSRLDAQQNPLTGELISKLEKNRWWKRILGESEYERLREVYGE